MSLVLTQGVHSDDHVLDLIQTVSFGPSAGSKAVPQPGKPQIDPGLDGHQGSSGRAVAEAVRIVVARPMIANSLPG